MEQYTLINNIGVSGTNLDTLHINGINTTTLAPHNTIFEFYFYLPNDARIYRATYYPSENIRLLNNGINLSHISDYQLSHHYNLQSLIRQQIQQQVQHDPIVYQQNSIHQQTFDTTHPISQVYLNSDYYNTVANGTVSYDVQNSIHQQSFDATQPTSQVYLNSDTYYTVANGTVSYDMQNSIHQQSFDTTQPTSQVYLNSDTYNTVENGNVSYDMQNSIHQQSGTTQPISQVYLNSDTYNTVANGTVSYDMQDMRVMEFQNSP
ncbi:unnamed protein product [Rhizophagus irregularis]|nr:unnamed protein product [Rhizophagus irregularis]